MLFSKSTWNTIKKKDFNNDQLDTKYIKEIHCYILLFLNIALREIDVIQVNSFVKREQKHMFMHYVYIYVYLS